MSGDRLDVIARNVDAAWLRTLAHFISQEPYGRFTNDTTLPNGESTVDGLRRIAEQHAGAVDALRVLATEVDRLRGPHADLMGVLDAPVTKALIAARTILGGQS